MGQRFQVLVKTNSEVLTFHLQWCYGEYTLQRAKQINDFMKEYLKYKHNTFNSVVARREEQIEIIKSLIGVNHEAKSFVTPHFCEGVSSIADTDNNDGWLIVDATSDKVRMAIILPSWLLGKKQHTVGTFESYLGQYMHNDMTKKECVTLVNKAKKLDKIAKIAPWELFEWGIM
jgi:hypothetical protein